MTDDTLNEEVVLGSRELYNTDIFPIAAPIRDESTSGLGGDA